MIINVINALRRRELEIETRKHRENLEGLVLERTEKLRQAQRIIRLSQEETIYRLARAAEFRDNETAQHTLRMAHYCKALALQSGFETEQSEMLLIAAQLHDVGKIGISDTILLKKGKLTREEFETVKQHAEIGFRILSGSESELIRIGAVIAHSHHEKYDGSGYPLGLSGEAIPHVGRIAAVCDVFDALTSDRVYKKAMSVEKSMEIMRNDTGKHFDPKLFTLFEHIIDDILRIKEKFADG